MGDFQAELDSIKAAANGMTTGAIATATELESVLKDLAGSTTASDWSDVPSCRAFGSTYVAAIQAYQKAAADMLHDATKMQSTLESIHAEYIKADDRRRDEFDARMAALGSEQYMTETDDARQGYDQHKGDLHSDDAQEAPDQQTQGATNTSTTTTTGTGTGGGNSGQR